MRTYNSKKYAEAYAERNGLYVEEVDGKYIVFTKSLTTDTTADITVVYEDVEAEAETPKKAKKKK